MEFNKLCCQVHRETAGLPQPGALQVCWNITSTIPTKLIPIFVCFTCTAQGAGANGDYIYAALGKGWGRKGSRRSPVFVSSSPPALGSGVELLVHRQTGLAVPTLELQMGARKKTLLEAYKETGSGSPPHSQSAVGERGLPLSEAAPAT